MQEQRFEKQVQEKMEELSLTPSAPVWEKVESEIRRKKEKRRVIVWALPFALLCGAAIWWFIQSPLISHSNDVASLEKNSTIKDPSREEHFNQVPKASTSSNENQNSHSNRQENKVEEPAVVQENSKTTEDTDQLHAAIVKKTKLHIELVQKRMASKSFKKLTTGSTQVKTKTNTSEPGQPPQEIRNQSLAAHQITKSPSAAPQLQTEVPQDPVRNLDTAINTQTLHEKSETTSATSEKKARSTSKWTWALQGGYGKSTVKTQLIEGQTTTLSNGNFTSPAMIGNGISYPPASRPKHSSSFSMGFSAKRTLNKHFALVSGLQFTYFSTKIPVGSNLTQAQALQSNFNQASSRYLSAGETKNYTNKYHFIDLPVGIEWKPLHQVPLYLQTGITLSRLLYTNALIYDQSTGIYFIDKESIDKNQLHVFSNVSYRIIKGKALSINAGPYIRYGVSGLQKGNVEREGHLLSGGIHTAISLNK